MENIEACFKKLKTEKGKEIIITTVIKSTTANELLLMRSLEEFNSLGKESVHVKVIVKRRRYL